MDGAARTFRIGALAHRNFRLFFYGQGVSLIGTWMQSVALGWLVLDLTNSAFAVGLNQALRSLGVLVCTLYAGIVVDRVDKRRLIVLTQLLQMAEAVALGVLVLAKVIAVWQVMVLALGFGVVNAFDIAARQAFCVLVAAMSLFGYPFLVLMPVFARDVLHRGAGGYGALMSSVGLGAMLGALALAVTGARVPKGSTMLAGAAAFCTLLIVFTAVRSFGAALVLLALDGCAMIVTTALANTMLQTLVPDEMRGRAMAFYAFVFVGMAPFGAFQAGLLAEHVGAPMAVALGAAACLAAVGLVAWRVPELRHTS